MGSGLEPGIDGAGKGCCDTGLWALAMAFGYSHETWSVRVNDIPGCRGILHSRRVSHDRVNVYSVAMTAIC